MLHITTSQISSTKNSTPDEPPRSVSSETDLEPPRCPTPELVANEELEAPEVLAPPEPEPEPEPFLPEAPPAEEAKPSKVGMIRLETFTKKLYRY